MQLLAYLGKSIVDNNQIKDYIQMELYIEPIRPQRNRINGQFLKRHTPFNKGKKWTDYMDMRKARRIIRVAKKNLRGRMDIGGYGKKQIIAFRDGEYIGVFESSTYAAKKLNLRAELIRKVCRGERTHTGGYKFYHETNYEQWKHHITT